MQIKKTIQSIAAFFRHKLVVVLLIIFGILCASIYPTYLITRYFFNRYFDTWGKKLVALEERGLLSKELGAAWQDVLAGEAMEEKAGSVIASETDTAGGVLMVDGIAVKDYPSLGIVARLNEVHAYSNTIAISDRKDRRIATIRTDHTRAKIDEFPKVFITALVAAEDSRFYKNELGFEFDSFVRAMVRAALRTITTFSLSSPKGTSTITQQVAKLFVSYLDETGQRYVSRSVDRKVRELRLSAALRKMYSADEVLEVYLNHCVASDYGLIGVKDIALGLFKKELAELTDAECVYIARMVKWGRNIHTKIARQCRIDMPRMAQSLGWDEAYQKEVLAAIDSLTFTKPKQIQTAYGHLVDLANEFWLIYLAKSNGGNAAYLKSMDIVDPNSLIRKKGNLTIKLSIDLPLQEYLESLVNARGFGSDTIIYTDVRIGSYGEDIKLDSAPEDSIRVISIIDTSTQFSEPNSEFYITLENGDTLVTNIRYRKKSKGGWRRSCYYYTRRLMKVDGQYFSYCILDSRTGKLLAYYSKDKIGSRLACLLRNPVPNGSSTAKPVLNALNFDLGNFPPYAKWSDSLPVTGDVPWKRTLVRKKDKPYEVIFAQSAVRGKGYQVHNHDYVFEGCQYIFDHLATSNNIFGVETIYRLNRKIFDPTGRVLPEAYPFAQLFYRLNALERIKETFKKKTITGVRIYKELARIVGIDVDTMIAYGKKVAVSDSLYSVALGTLEMTLLEQAHIFNMLYNNDLIEQPAQHPSLIVDSININGVGIAMADCDVVRRYHPFSDVNNIRPTYLGMHKRLISNRWDGLTDYDIPYESDETFAPVTDNVYNADAYLFDTPLSNYAKSGTTDDMLRPFNVDVTSKQRTNYGLWNAVIRIDLSRLSGEIFPDVRDVTIACIGECNDKHTGPRDGKTLHKYVSRDLLKKGGRKSSYGFFSQYEQYLKKVTPDSVKYCGVVIEEENPWEPGEEVVDKEE